MNKKSSTNETNMKGSEVNCDVKSGSQSKVFFSSVFVLCIALCLASAVNSSPIEIEIGASNDVSVLFEPIKQLQGDGEVDEVAELPEEGIIEIEELEQNEVDETVHVINETSEDEVAVPYEDKAGEQALVDEEKSKVIVNEEKPAEDVEGEAFQDEFVDDYVEMTEEEKEVILGIDIPLCMQHTDARIPLHLR